MSEETQPEAEAAETTGQAVQEEESEQKFDAAYVKQLRDEAAKYRVKLKEHEDAKKTEAEKQAEALAEAEKELAELRAGKLRAEVAAEKGVPAELLHGGDRESLEAAADALIKFRDEKAKNSLIVPNETKTPSRNEGTTADVFASFLEEKLN